MRRKFWMYPGLFQLKIGLGLLGLLMSFSAQSQSKLCTGILGNPIISNDFGSGTPLYNTSQIRFSTTFTLWNKAGTNDGYYSIVNQIPNDFRLQGTNVWLSGNDHTSNDGKGYMMLVNADEKLGEFYKDTVDNLCLGGTYEFSSYLANIFKLASAFPNPVNSIPPKVRFEIRDLAGNIIDSISTGNINNANTLSWQKYGITFKSPSTSIVLVMVSTAARGTGNDIVLDDIVFRPCTPATISITPILNVCEKGSGIFTVSVQGNADYKFSKWQVSRNNGKDWDYFGSTITQTTNAINYNVDLSLNNILVSDDSSLYRLILSTSEPNLLSVNSVCNVTSPSSVLRVNVFPILKINDPDSTCNTPVNLTNPKILTGSSIGNSIKSYYRNLADATSGNNALNLLQAQTIVVQGQYFIKASSNTSPSCVDIKPVNVSIVQPRTLNLSGPLPKCKDNPTFTITASTVNISFLSWTKAGNVSILQTGTSKTFQLVPTAIDLAKDSIFIKVVSKDASLVCPNIEDSIKVVFYDAPTLKLPHDTVICENTASINISVSAKVSNNPDLIKWRSSNPITLPTPTTGNNTTLNFSGHNLPTRLIATVSKNGCNPRNDTMEILFAAKPLVDAGPDTSFCLGHIFTRRVLPNNLYSYKWTILANGVMQDSVSLINALQFIPSANTTITLTAKTTEGCTESDDFAINALTPPSITLPSHLCFKPGTSLVPILNFTPLNGTYSWSRDNIFLSSSPTISTFNVAQSGNYTFQYKDSGCVSSASTLVSLPPVLTLPDKQACVGANVILETPLINKAKYSWNNGSFGIQSKFSTIATNSILTVELNVVDSLGCLSGITSKISGVPIPIFTLSSIGVCEGETGKIKTTLLDPTLESNFLLGHKWSQNGKMITGSSWKEINFDELASYSLTISIGDCEVNNSINSVIFPLPTLQAQEKYVYCSEEIVPVELRSNSLEAKQFWYLGNQLIGSKPQISVHPDSNAVYLLVVEDKNKCKASQSVFVTVCCEPRLFVPNVITPFSDDINSTLKIFGKYFTNFNLTVFSRWGEVIYATKDCAHSWKGDYKNEAMPIGNYPWLVTYEGSCPDFRGPYKKVGEVSVVR